VAGRLLTAAERAARRLGADRIRLEVRRDNRPAYALYARAGYAQFGLRPGYYADGMDAARLEKALRS
jgi:ribosomal-protein-alanine N-acetyltransferase